MLSLGSDAIPLQHHAVVAVGAVGVQICSCAFLKPRFDTSFEYFRHLSSRVFGLMISQIKIKRGFFGPINIFVSLLGGREVEFSMVF